MIQPSSTDLANLAAAATLGSLGMAGGFSVSSPEPTVENPVWEEHGWGLGWRGVGGLVASVLALSLAAQFTG